MNINRLIWITTTALFAIAGAIAGWTLGGLYTTRQAPGSMATGPMRQLVIMTMALGLAVVMARVGSWLADHVVAGLGRVHQLSVADRVLGIIGVLLGLMFGVLVIVPLTMNITGWWTIPLKFCVMAVSAGLGMALLQGMRTEMLRVFPQLDEPRSSAGGVVSGAGYIPKLLDTNVIIDGRIADLCRTGFIEGPIFVPNFVLNELQYIADSSDSLRRARGRRGLETLNSMREITLAGGSSNGSADSIPVVQVLNDIPSSVMKIDTVDSKLVFLAKEMNGSILTNDFNLNRVAELQGVRVLNLNELAQALKPVVLPGEEMTLTIVREGKEPGQGVGYLEDGTMVVVGDGNKHVGETCKVIISSVYQTLAGKMIFADLKGIKGAGDDLFHGNGTSGGGERGRSGDDLGHRAGSGLRRKGKP